MTPFASFTYFGVALYPTLPAIAEGFVGRRSSRQAVLVAAILGMTLFQYAGEIWIVAGFAAIEWAVAVGLLQSREQGRRWPLWISVGASLAPLVAAKLGSPLEFLGISYVTFRTLDVVFGIHDGVITRLPPTRYLAYLFFFPTVSAGPIDRFRRFERDWNAERDRGAFLEDLDQAVQRIVRGFYYKFLLAALIEKHWLAPAESAEGMLGMLSYTYAYSLYLFFDFAGYSAFAVGISYLFGIRTPENFDQPFRARNIRDFWNRWHVSLSAWFRDHVYTRFVLAAAKRRWFTDLRTASRLGFVLAMGLMGLWHGLARHYVAYGLYHGALLVGHDAFTQWNAEQRLWGDGWLWNAAAIFVTFHFVAFGFLIFSGHLFV